MSEPNTPAQNQPGYESIIDRADGENLPADNPNAAGSEGDKDHEKHIGDPVDDDGGVGEATARLEAGE